MKISKIGWIAGFVIFCISILRGDLFISAIGIGLVGISFFDFLYKIGREFPILEMVLLLAVLQLILGPYFAYRLPVPYFRYRMYIPEIDYMAISVPSHLLLWAGLSIQPISFNLKSLKLKIKEILVLNPNIGMHIIGVGVFSFFSRPFLPTSLGFLIYLSTGLIYIGGLLYYFSENKKYRLLVYLCTIGVSFTEASLHGVFHDFLIWLIFGLTLILLNFSFKMHTKLLFFALGFFFIIVLQNVKAEYRSLISSGHLTIRERMLTLFTSSNKVVYSIGENFTQRKLSELNVRLNQGWITSAIFFNVPSNVPFENGKTIVAGIVNSFLPRVLFSDKKNSGGREMYRLYTGIPIDDNTSMGIGLLGEAYVNFGYFAGVFLFLWGVLINRIIWSIYFFSQERNIVLFFMIPLIFNQVIKVETDMITVLNHLVKAIILL